MRLDELCSFMPRAADPDEVVALHDMRIAAKRLRYVLEVTGSVFGDYAEKATSMVKDLQDLLGEIHDCDVQIPEVRAFRDELELRDALDLVERAGDAPDLDPKLLRRRRPPARPRRAWPRCSSTCSARREAAVHALPRALERLRAQGLPRAARICRDASGPRCPLLRIASCPRDRPRAAAARRGGRHGARPHRRTRCTSTASSRGCSSTIASCSSRRTPRSSCWSG